MELDPVASLVKQVDPAKLQGDVASLAKAVRHSLCSPARHTETADYISEVLAQCGLETRQHTHQLGERQGINVVGSTPGTSPQALRPILVSAHYDTVNDSPGADDNASGVAALLECARVLSKVKLSRGVEFVAFDLEEKQPEGGALVGSTAFVKASGGKHAYEGLYNLEMVGYTSGPGTQGYPLGFQFILPRAFKWAQRRSFLGDFIGVVARGPGIDLGRRFQAAAERWVPGLEVLAIELRHRLPLLVDLFRSDHAPFWAAGVPAIMITDTANFRNPHYHRPTDIPETLDYPFLSNVTRTLVATVAEQCELA